MIGWGMHAVSAPHAAATVLLSAALWAIPPSVSRTRVRDWRRADRASRASAPRTGTGGGTAHGRARLVRRGIPVAAAGAAFIAGAAWSWAAAAAIVIACAAAHRIRRGRAAGREAEVRERHLALALEVVISELRVGAHPGRACSVAAAQVPAGEVSRRLGAAAAQAGLGGAVSQALAADRPEGFGGHPGAASSGEDRVAWAGRHGKGGRAEDDVDAGPWRRVAAVWSVAEQRGIALADLLDAARRDLLVRASFRARAEAGLAGARSTALILAVLPVVGVGFGYLMGARPLAVLTGGGLGSVLLIGGVLLDCAGLLWAERIGRGVGR